MSKQESTAMDDGKVSRKSGDFTYYAESYRNRIRSYRYKFTRDDDAWRRKLHSLIFDDLMLKTPLIRDTSNMFKLL